VVRLVAGALTLPLTFPVPVLGPRRPFWTEKTAGRDDEELTYHGDAPSKYLIHSSGPLLRRRRQGYRRHYSA
jgi:hypothetical protein